MYKNAFGVIDLLLGLVIISVMFMLMMPTLKGGSSLNMSGQNQKSIQERVNRQVEEIEHMRQQSVNYPQPDENY
ncbi:MAG: hypothetical protein LBJ74_02200 [Heliobacteriaceae bacterium]|jgi:competence protein ComGC|nr:hypothetical protein [Heliobacteriaceae bacterium]